MPTWRREEKAEAGFGQIGFVVVDTLARCFVGQDENTAKDIGELVDGVDTIRRRLSKATIMFIHHPTKDGKTERGSGALLGAMTTAIRVDRKPPETVAKLSCKKQKEAEEFAPISLSLARVGESLVVTGIGTASRSDPQRLARRARHKTLRVVSGLAGESNASVSSAEIITEALKVTGRKERAIRNHLKQLCETDDYLDHDEAASAYAITDGGLQALANEASPATRHIPDEIRQTILDCECVECGSTEDLQVDHIVPYAAGGSNEVDNLQPLCKACNRQKGDRHALTTDTELDLTDAG